MTNKTCPHCHGRGQIVREDGDVQTCRCAALRQVLFEIVRTPGLEGLKRLGPHLVPEGKPIEGHAVVSGDWPEFRESVGGWLFRHLSREAMKPKIKILLCSDLRALYVKNEADTLRGNDVLIIRVLGTKGKENTLTQDAIMTALSLGPSVWLVSPPDDDYGEGHPSWNSHIEAGLTGASRVNLAPKPKGRDFSILKSFDGGDK